MKKVPKTPYFHSIPDFLQMLGHTAGAASGGNTHPLIEVLDLASLSQLKARFPHGVSAGFYQLIFVRSFSGSLPYSQRFREFNNGCVSFLGPGKVLREKDLAGNREGLILLIHEDLFRGHALERVIRGYEFWAYAPSEALFLPDAERSLMQQMLQGIGRQVDRPSSNSTDLLVPMLEQILNLGDRLYQMQFQRRRLAHQDLFGRMGQALHDYLEKGHALLKGLPSTDWVSERVGLSKAYLDTMLHTLRGHDLQRQLMEMLVERGKHLLQHTELTPAEVAYSLGFEDFGSFTRIFKQWTRLSPNAFRMSLA